MKKQRHPKAKERRLEYKKKVEIFNDFLMEHDYEIKLSGNKSKNGFVISLKTDIPLSEATCLLDWERVKNVHISTAV